MAMSAAESATGGKRSSIFVRQLLAWLTLLTAVLAQPVQAQAVDSAPLLVLDSAQTVSSDASLEFFLDSQGQFTAEQIDRQPSLRFTPIQRGKRYLLGGGALWLRFDAVIKNPSVHWRLTVPLAGVDEATLYFRNTAGQWVVQRAGDSRPMSSWAQPARYPVFSLSHEADQPIRYYLQIRHDRVPYSAMPRIVSDAELINSSLAEHLGLGIYFGLSALVILLALVNAATYRDSGFGTYALYIAVFAASQAGFTGIAGLYWWPEWPGLNRATIFLLPTAAACALWFVRTVTLPRRFAPALDRTMLTLMILLPLGALVDAFLPTPASYVVMNGMISISLVVIFVVLGLGLAAGDFHTRWVVIGFTPVLLATLFPLLRNLNLIASGFLSNYALLLGSALEVPILYYGLHRRVSQRRDLNARASGLGNTDPLTGLHSSNVFQEKLRQSMVTAKRYKLPFAVLLVNLSNFASVTKNQGREAAGRTIVTAATRIRGAAHSTDTLARVGDAHFALLLEGPISPAEANAMATRILASGLRPSNDMSEAEPLQFHIAVGHLDGAIGEAREDAGACLARMLQAVNSLNDGSGKAIRLVKL